MDQKDTEIFVDTDGRTYKQLSPEQLRKKRKILYIMLSSFLMFIVVVIGLGVFLACVVGSCLA